MGLVAARLRKLTRLTCKKPSLFKIIPLPVAPACLLSGQGKSRFLLLLLRPGLDAAGSRPALPQGSCAAAARCTPGLQAGQTRNTRTEHFLG